MNFYIFETYFPKVENTFTDILQGERLYGKGGVYMRGELIYVAVNFALNIRILVLVELGHEETLEDVFPV